MEPGAVGGQEIKHQEIKTQEGDNLEEREDQEEQEEREEETLNMVNFDYKEARGLPELKTINSDTEVRDFLACIEDRRLLR